MNVHPRLDDELHEFDVKYRIADCRKRMRSQRFSLRALHHPAVVSTRPIKSSSSDLDACVEIVASASSSASSIKPFVDRMSAPVGEGVSATEESLEEAAIT
jgi:hypothetical protein